MTDGGKITWVLDIDDSQFKVKAKNASSEADNLSSGVGGKLGGAFGMATKASAAFAVGLTAATAAVTGLLAKGVTLAADLESAEAGFTALLGSSKKAGETMARIKKEAAKTPFEIAGLTTGVQAITAITKDGNKAIDVIMDIGKAISLSGKGQAEFDSVVMNLQQVMSTGAVTETDIRQFQRAIPLFNDIIAGVGLTTEELKNSANAGELLMEAFEKAGAKGGIAFEGFSAQAGTFNQLWSNLKDSIAIGLSDIVKMSGIFDLVKTALDQLIIKMNEFITPENIKIAIQFLKDNFLFIAGAITAMLIPALISLASFLAPILLHFIALAAIGATVGFVVQRLIEHFGGVEAIIKQLQPTLDLLANVFETQFKPTLLDTWNIISQQLIPSLKLLWVQISPVLIPVLKVLAAIIGGTLLVALKLLIEQIRMWVQIFTWSVQIVNGLIARLVADFKALPGLIKAALAYLPDFIEAPFRAAFDKIMGMAKAVADKIRSALSSAFDIKKRNSPSILDRLNILKDAVSGTLSDIQIPTYSSQISDNIGSQTGKLAYAGAGSSSPNFTVNIGTYAGSDMEKRELARQIFEAYGDYAKGRGATI